VSNPQKRKGDIAELEIARMIADLTGWPVRRKLGAGRTDDTGDLDGIPDTVCQVKSWADGLAAIRACIADLPTQRANAGATHAVGLVRLRGGTWVAVMDVPTWCTWAREAVG
jgi:hypothetical protein